MAPGKPYTLERFDKALGTSMCIDDLSLADLRATVEALERAGSRAPAAAPEPPPPPAAPAPVVQVVLAGTPSEQMAALLKERDEAVARWREVELWARHARAFHEVRMERDGALRALRYILEHAERGEKGLPLIVKEAQLALKRTTPDQLPEVP